MKKFIMALVAFVFCMGCASAPKQLPAPPTPTKYEVTIINKTDNLALGVACLAKFPPQKEDECLYGGMMLFPERRALENPKLPYKVTVYLEKGDYIIFILGKDLLTGKEMGGTHIIFQVTGDGEFSFKDKKMNVERGNSC